MIVKIKDPQSSKWYIWDSVKTTNYKLDYHSDQMGEIEEIFCTAEEIGANMLANPPCYEDLPQDKNEHPIMDEAYWWGVIDLCMEDNSKIRILFDDIAYICNNNGKTIEKLVAGYVDLIN